MRKKKLGGREGMEGHVVDHQDEENRVEDLEEVQRQQTVARHAHLHPWNETEEERRKQFQHRCELLRETSHGWNQRLQCREVRQKEVAERSR